MVARTMLAVLLMLISAGAWASDATPASPAAPAAPAAPKDGLRGASIGALAKKISFEFVDTPQNECVEFIASFCKASIILDPRASGLEVQVPINLKVSKMKAWEALDWVLKLAELDSVSAHGAVFITAERRVSAFRRRLAREKTRGRSDALSGALGKKISFEFIDTPIDEGVNYLRTLTGVRVKLVGAPPTPVSLHVREMATADAFWWVARLAGCDLKIEGDRVVMVPSKKIEPDWREELEEKLCRRVNWYYRESPLGEGVVGLLFRHGVQVHLDAGALEREKTPVTMKLSCVRLGVALEKVLDAAGLDYCLRPGEVYISTPAMVKWQRSVVATAEKLRAEERRCRGPAAAASPSASRSVFAWPLADAAPRD